MDARPVTGHFESTVIGLFFERSRAPPLVRDKILFCTKAGHSLLSLAGLEAAAPTRSGSTRRGGVTEKPYAKRAKNAIRASEIKQRMIPQLHSTASISYEYGRDLLSWVRRMLGNSVAPSLPPVSCFVVSIDGGSSVCHSAVCLVHCRFGYRLGSLVGARPW